MIFCVFIFTFCLEPTVREEMNQDNFRHYHGIFFEGTILKFRSNYEALWQRHLKWHLTVEGFTDMNQHGN